MTTIIQIFHWLFTLKILHQNLFYVPQPPDSIDITRQVLSILAVVSLLWNLRRSWPVGNFLTSGKSELLNGLLMNAVFLTAATMIELVMTLPYSINHCFLEFYISIFLLLLNTSYSSGEYNYAMISKLYLSVWWIAAIQKVVNGRFLNGESFMVEWDTDYPSELGKSLEFVRSMLPQVDAHHLFVGLAVMVFLTELLLPIVIILNPHKRYLWLGMFAVQIGVWQATGEKSFAITGLILCFLGLAGPIAPMRICSRVPKAIFVALVLWPFVHMGLVMTYGFSPWRLGGWGMYSTPHFLQEYEVVFKLGSIKEYSRRQIPWPEEQRKSVENDQKLYIEFNSESAHGRLLEAFRNIVAPKYRDDVEVIRRKYAPKAKQRGSALIPHSFSANS